MNNDINLKYCAETPQSTVGDRNSLKPVNQVTEDSYLGHTFASLEPHSELDSSSSDLSSDKSSSESDSSSEPTAH